MEQRSNKTSTTRNTLMCNSRGSLIVRFTLHTCSLITYLVSPSDNSLLTILVVYEHKPLTMKRDIFLVRILFFRTFFGSSLVFLPSVLKSIRFFRNSRFSRYLWDSGKGDVDLLELSRNDFPP